MDELSVPQGGCGEEQGVNAVQDAAVAGKQGAGVFDAGGAFEGGFGEVAHLGGEIFGSEGDNLGTPTGGLGEGFVEVAASGEGGYRVAVGKLLNY